MEQQQLCDLCTEPRVSGSVYCEDHQLEQMLKVKRPSPTGTLAQMIQNATKQGLITPTFVYSAG